MTNCCYFLNIYSPKVRKVIMRYVVDKEFKAELSKVEVWSLDGSAGANDVIDAKLE
jgi:hypothetical protein